MIPIYYDNRYLPLLDLCYEQPVSSFREDTDIIEDGTSGCSIGDAPDPADKDGTDGKVHYFPKTKMGKHFRVLSILIECRQF